MPLSAKTTSRGTIAGVLLTLAAGVWTACDSPLHPVPLRVVDTVYVLDTVPTVDTVYITKLPGGEGTTRFSGALAWGGGPPLNSSAHIAAVLPEGRWGIGTDQPESRLHIRDGEFRLAHENFDFLVSGQFQGSNPAGFGLTLGRDANIGRRPLGVTFQQGGQNLWGIGVDEASWQPYPDYIAVFESAVGDIFRFRTGGRAILGNGVGHPGPDHVLTLVDRENDFIDNVLNLVITETGSAARYLLAQDHQGRIDFAIGSDGRMGVGRDASPEVTLAVKGEIESRGYRQLSDARLKREVRALGGALERVSRVRPVRYRWMDEMEKGEHIGVVAQEVEAVFPELVRETGDGLKSVDYQGMTVLLLKAVQELTARVEELEAGR